MSQETAFTTFIDNKLFQLQEQCRVAAEQQAAAQQQGDYAAYRLAQAGLGEAQNGLAYWADYKARNAALYAPGKAG
ncbi:hypothetical protein [Candidatus Tokpelaia sp.]|uniref:hypothetical protein n=1 Tax=Candidatus Tokpelaia sp. TaxID=2233777 RepID=UPI0012395BFA|nr:hypothetical protein [Candidatus Tokpelaia sp.]KAA6404616.1 hypothetical protein DPQ22_09045 [Candidatus Tokpelaia sp.]